MSGGDVTDALKREYSNGPVERGRQLLSSCDPLSQAWADRALAAEEAHQKQARSVSTRDAPPPP